jgi:hypothetical protein
MYKIITEEKEYFLTISDIIKKIKSDPSQKYFKQIDNELILINNDLVLNTKFICHRINKIDELTQIDSIFGIELDLRDDHKSGKLILAHDPFIDGELFEEYLKYYDNNILILNIKSERVEIECLKLMEQFNIQNYFFLDSSFPMINLLNQKYSCNKIASRFSEYECLEYTENIKDLVEWIWVDCFTKLPLDEIIFNKIRNIGKKICIVSPELQGQTEKINQYRIQLINNNIIPDSICCKEYNIYKWI